MLILSALLPTTLELCHSFGHVSVAMRFDRKRQPLAITQSNKRNHAHVMISIWPKFDSDTSIWQQMKEHGYLIAGDNYDVTNSAARDLYWRMLPGTLLAKGVDALWMDDSEPEGNAGEGGIAPGQQLYFGRSDLYTNIYPFMHTYGAYRHWRDTMSQKRVFLLTRSSFLGQQHNAAAAWSGGCIQQFLGIEEAGSGRAELRTFRNAVLDHRYRRLRLS